MSVTGASDSSPSDGHQETCLSVAVLYLRSFGSYQMLPDCLFSPSFELPFANFSLFC